MSKISDDDRERLHVKPACFSPSEWADWSAHTLHHPNSLDWACTDCTPAFKAKMLAARRCSWPCVEFFQYEDGIEGRRMSVANGERLPRIVDGVTIIPIKVVE